MLLLAVTSAVYLPALGADFVTWDDDVYVTDNPHIRTLSPEMVARLFTEPHFGLYQPLTLLSLALDYRIAGLDAAWYHAVNLLLHLLNTGGVLLFLLLLTTRFDVAFVTAAIFAVHPLQVESVAWVTERKNVLYTLFFLGSLVAYVRYTRSPRRWLYLGSFGLFLLSLLAKAQAATLAPTLLLVDFFLGRRLASRRLLLEKVPFFAAALVIGLVALSAQEGVGALQTSMTVGERLVYGSYNLIQHVQRLAIPAGLSVVYPDPFRDGAGAGLRHLGYVIAAFGVIAALPLSIRWTRTVAFGGGFLLVNVLPVLQFIPAGTAMMNDRFAYVPAIGFAFLVGSGVAAIRKARPRLSGHAVALLAGYLLLLSAATFERAKVWENGLTLWNDAIEEYPEYPVAYVNRGVHWMGVGKLREAVSDFTSAIRLDPGYAKAYNNRGSAYIRLGDHARAIEDLDRALALDPTYAEAYYNRGLARDHLGDTRGAVADYTLAIAHDERLAPALYGRGSARANLGDVEGALADLDRALELRPDHPEAFLRRGVLREVTGDVAGACTDWRRAARLGSRDAAERVLERCAEPHTRVER